MPRQARLLLANTPHHIVQRGHNRDVIFMKDDDYNYYVGNVKGMEAGARRKSLWLLFSQ